MFSWDCNENRKGGKDEVQAINDIFGMSFREGFPISIVPKTEFTPEDVVMHRYDLSGLIGEFCLREMRVVVFAEMFEPE